MKGEVFPAEMRTFTDAVTGVAVRQLTHYKAHSHHLVLHQPRLVRCGSPAALSPRPRQSHQPVQPRPGELRDYPVPPIFDPPPPPTEVQFIDACVNPRRAEAYFWYGR